MDTKLGQMTDEHFRHLIKEDYWISHIAHPVKCCYADGRFKHFRTCTYPYEYILSDEQISIAKKEYQRRHNEELANLKKGELAFVCMGMDFTPRTKNGIGNHRIRAEFRNSKGTHYFVEFSTCLDPYNFFVDYSIERETENGDVYGARGISGEVYIPSTFPDVLEFINTHYDCNYTKVKLFHFFVTTDDYICEC